ncbi:hypothetical protein ACP4OV_021180 [Aristida adscensionis]
MDMERPISSKLILALLLLVLAPPLDARRLDSGGPCEDGRRCLRSSPLMLPSCRDGAAVAVVPAPAINDVAARGWLGRPGGRVPPAPAYPAPRRPGGDPPPRPHYRRGWGPELRPEDVLRVIRDTIFQFVVGA